MEGIYWWANIEPRDKSILKDIAKLAGLLNLLASELRFEHRKLLVDEYEGHGVTVVLTIGESHMVVETWPENNEMRITVESCVYRDGSEILNAIRDLLKIEHILWGMIDRARGRVC